FSDPEDTFISFVGRFYLHENHLKPQEIFVPIGTKYELLTELLDVDVHTPFRGPKRKLVELAEKNAKLSLQERFTLLERDEERTILAVEKLGDAFELKHHTELKRLITRIFKVQIPSQRWSFLSMGVPIKKNIANIKLEESRVLMTMKRCEKSFGGGIHVY